MKRASLRQSANEDSSPAGWAHAMAGFALCAGRFIDDAFVLVGAVLIGVGVWRYWPGCTWFYAGGCCVVVGILLGLPNRRQTQHVDSPGD